MGSEQFVDPNETLECTTPICSNTFTVSETIYNSGICSDCGFKHDRLKGQKQGIKNPNYSNNNARQNKSNSDNNPVVNNVTLEVEGYRFTTELGEPIGKQVRKSLLKAGRDNDIARRVHREHIQFDINNGQVTMEVLGKLGIVIDGVEFKKDDVVSQINLGDTISFSDEKYDITANITSFD